MWTEAQNDAFLGTFRSAAESMRVARGESEPTWCWIGQHMSQQMYDLPRERAEEYAKRHGGTARPMRATER